MRSEPQLLRALLRHWRRRRGMSQLDLALAADVSARHVSFLETGRARPSRAMVMRLGSVLDLPLRSQNELLRAAGFEAEFAEPRLADGLPAAIEDAMQKMAQAHEPFPLMFLNHRYDVLRANRGAQRILARTIADPGAVTGTPNLYRLLFDPRLVRPAVVEWERSARAHLARLHRESLARPDEELAELVRSLLDYPGVPPDFRQPDFSGPSEPFLTLRLRCGDDELGFLATVTVFSAPQNVTLDELRIESYFPVDDATRRACERLAEA